MCSKNDDKFSYFALLSCGLWFGRYQDQEKYSIEAFSYRMESGYGGHGVPVFKSQKNATKTSKD